ncbi:hypothetical protein TPAU25S_01287 [Tsukamurella paurometabola]|uniref:FAD-dependent monooxygenase n=1 Tax=Tsukamurella paurometabola TaxID=2061 RepID=UPI00019F0F34|nr:FAD-dependent monooxygenase [Tsukamurella paurometabola]SUP27720.1 Uncharacterized conserved protein [Tsukamurella paurometabola]
MRTAAIIGGGIGGLATAALLTGQGWEVEVFERAASLPTTGTALGMWPEALAVLDRTGAGAKVREIGIDQRFGEIRSCEGHRLGPRIEARGATVLISRPRLLEALAAAAPRSGSAITAPISRDSITTSSWAPTASTASPAPP